MPPPRRPPALLLLAAAATAVLRGVAGQSYVRSLVGGQAHSLVLRSDGTLWSTGSNQYGQLCDGTTVQKQRPVLVALSATQTLTGVVAASAGAFHSVFLRSDGTAFACGQNQYGQLGDGTTNQRNRPVAVPLMNVTAVSAGFEHTILLRKDGTVYAAGHNWAGQLGTDASQVNPDLVKISSVTGVRSIATGGWHTVFLKKDGTVWVAGWNRDGQLGLGPSSDGYAAALPKSRPEYIPLHGVRSVSAGLEHSVFLLWNGSVFCTGSNTFGQLGDGANVTLSLQPIEVQVDLDIRSAVAQGHHTLLVTVNNSVYGFGLNMNGQLADGTRINRVLPQLLPVDNVREVSLGYQQSAFLQLNGSVYVAGDNEYGQLGDGTTLDHLGLEYVPYSIILPATDDGGDQDSNAPSLAGRLVAGAFVGFGGCLSCCLCMALVALRAAGVDPRTVVKSGKLWGKEDDSDAESPPPAEEDDEERGAGRRLGEADDDSERAALKAAEPEGEAAEDMAAVESLPSISRVDTSKDQATLGPQRRARDLSSSSSAAAGGGEPDEPPLPGSPSR